MCIYTCIHEAAACLAVYSACDIAMTYEIHV